MQSQPIPCRKPGPGRPKQGRASPETIKSARVQRSKERAAAFSFMPDDGLADLSMFCSVFSWSRSTFYRRQAAGLIPPPANLPGAKRWRVGDIRKLLAAAQDGNG
jgi:predicted DNA-binding transcriptional regulator AlpA